ncbi:MAG: hypothetical protein LBC42_02600 [Puniceicoccales bacterium]|nr:hypothetical protein [Puniceicoccales bacterium]
MKNSILWTIRTVIVVSDVAFWAVSLIPAKIVFNIMRRVFSHPSKTLSLFIALDHVYEFKFRTKPLASGNVFDDVTRNCLLYVNRSGIIFGSGPFHKDFATPAVLEEFRNTAFCGKDIIINLFTQYFYSEMAFLQVAQDNDTERKAWNKVSAINALLVQDLISFHKYMHEYSEKFGQLDKNSIRFVYVVIFRAYAAHVHRIIFGIVGPDGRKVIQLPERGRRGIFDVEEPLSAIGDEDVKSVTGHIAMCQMSEVRSKKIFNVLAKLIDYRQAQAVGAGMTGCVFAININGDKRLIRHILPAEIEQQRVAPVSLTPFFEDVTQLSPNLSGRMIAFSEIGKIFEKIVGYSPTFQARILEIQMEDGNQRFISMSRAGKFPVSRLFRRKNRLPDITETAKQSLIVYQIFLMLTGQMDSHLGNVLYDQNDEIFRAIDPGHAFGIINPLLPIPMATQVADIVTKSPRLFPTIYATHGEILPDHSERTAGDRQKIDELFRQKFPGAQPDYVQHFYVYNFGTCVRFFRALTPDDGRILLESNFRESTIQHCGQQVSMQLADAIKAQVAKCLFAHSQIPPLTRNMKEMLLQVLTPNNRNKIHSIMRENNFTELETAKQLERFDCMQHAVEEAYAWEYPTYTKFYKERKTLFNGSALGIIMAI